MKKNILLCIYAVMFILHLAILLRVTDVPVIIQTETRVVMVVSLLARLFRQRGRFIGVMSCKNDRQTCRGDG